MAGNNSNGTNTDKSNKKSVVSVSGETLEETKDMSETSTMEDVPPGMI